jgi:hypothetical protein
MKKKKLKTAFSATKSNTVTLEEFEQSTEAWLNVTLQNNGMLDAVILANSYKIKSSDILDLAQEIIGLGTERAQYVRAYVGIQEFDDDPNLSEMKLFFTGVNSAGLPILQNSEGESAIYDFVTPCPPTC